MRLAPKWLLVVGFLFVCLLVASFVLFRALFVFVFGGLAFTRSLLYFRLIERRDN